MRNRLIVVIMLLIISTTSSASSDANTFEYIFEFDEPGHMVYEVAFNETIPINNTSSVQITIPESSVRGTNFTLVVISNENETVLTDYNEYNRLMHGLYISENITENFELANETEINWNYGVLRTANRTENPYKFLIIMYYEGTGKGIIELKLSITTVKPHLDGYPTTEDMNNPFYLTVFVLTILTYRRKMRD